MLRRWLLRRLELRLVDVEDRITKWGWSDKPSAKAFWKKRKERLQRRVARLRAKMGLEEDDDA
jgi:hypothetical protein